MKLGLVVLTYDDLKSNLCDHEPFISWLLATTARLVCFLPERFVHLGKVIVLQALRRVE